MNKSIFLSKTFWFGIVTAVAPLFPVVNVWVTENVAVVGMLWGSLAIVLRLVTKDKVILVE